MCDIKAQVSKLEIGPGEVLLVRVPNDRTDEEMHHAHSVLRNVLPVGAKHLIVKLDGTEFTVVKEKKDE